MNGDYNKSLINDDGWPSKRDPLSRVNAWIMCVDLFDDVREKVQPGYNWQVFVYHVN